MLEKEEKYEETRKENKTLKGNIFKLNVRIMFFFFNILNFEINFIYLL